jgi:hypothetical protein
MTTFRGIGRASGARLAAMEPEKKHVDQRAPAARRRAAALPPALAKTSPSPPPTPPLTTPSAGELVDQLYAQGSAYVGRAAEASAHFSHEALANKLIEEGARGLAQREGSPARGGLAAEAEGAEHLKGRPPEARLDAVDLVRARLAAELGPDEQEKLADEALAAAARRWERERGAPGEHAAATDPIALLQAVERELRGQARRAQEPRRARPVQGRPRGRPAPRGDAGGRQARRRADVSGRGGRGCLVLSREGLCLPPACVYACVSLPCR